MGAIPIFSDSDSHQTDVSPARMAATAGFGNIRPGTSLVLKETYKIKESMTNELRIGNLVGFEKIDGTGLSIGQVTSLSVHNHFGIDGIGVCRWPIEEKRVFLGETQTFSKAVGIPLTKKWLLKFGFIEGQCDWYYKGCFSVCILESGLCKIGFGENKVFKVKIPFVHRFQNLYFDLVEKELGIKETKLQRDVRMNSFHSRMEEYDD